MFPTFAEFFHAVYRMDPFPWQQRLADDVEEGDWHDIIGVPTGLGKTACIDIAVWALAKQATLEPRSRTAPTRIWYVVDRRLLIDAAHNRAQQLANKLLEAEQQSESGSGSDGSAACLSAVASALRALQGVALSTALQKVEEPSQPQAPLHVVRLRGGAELGKRAPAPSQPTIVVATVAMYGSRLLFRGYGTSRLMRPVDAALAGTDSLVLLDEAHIARPLRHLVATTADCDAGDPERILPKPRARPRLVALTATSDPGNDRFDLDDADQQHPIIAQRLKAAKPTRLEAVQRSMADTLACEAAKLVDRPGSTVVFCNTVKAARTVFEKLQKLRGETRGIPLEIKLLTGRMRKREADKVREDVIAAVGSDRDRSTLSDKHLIIVATQTLEVGADLDFDHLVTECAGTRALIQRFGRLNRLGETPKAEAVICGDPDAPPLAPYGPEPKDVWHSLNKAIADTPDQRLDMSPGNIRALLGQPDDVPKRYGELLPSHLWEFVKTTQEERGEPDVESFFSEFDDEPRTLSVVWRAQVPVARNGGDHASGDVISENDLRVVPSISEDEAVEIPLGEFRAFAKAHNISDVTRLSSDRTTVERSSVPPNRLRAGDVVLLRTDRGGYDEYGWAPDRSDAVLDIRTLEWPALWLDAAALARFTTHPLGPALKEALSAAVKSAEDEEAGWDERRKALTTIISALQDTDTHPWVGANEWTQYLTELRSTAENADEKTLHKGDNNGWILQPLKSKRPLRSDVADDLSFDTAPLGLYKHCSEVEEIATGVSESIGLGSDLQTVVAKAARYHDLGKADPRFQRLLDPEGLLHELWAKSKMQRGRTAVRTDWPRGGRHETISAQLLREWQLTFAPDGATDEELVLHLVLSHHGHGRPLVRPAATSASPTFEVFVDRNLVNAKGALSDIDWDQPHRFRKLCNRYGFWGLALLEAIVRQSDHIASAAAEGKPVEVV